MIILLAPQDQAIISLTPGEHAMKNGLDAHAAIRDAVMISGKAIMINVASVSG